MDLYNIPNDTGHPWRLNKYVEYNYKASPVDSAILSNFAFANDLNPDQCIMLAWYHSLTYCELTACLLFQNLPYTVSKSTVTEYWAENKETLQFNSARLYVKSMDWFIPLMTTFMSKIKRQPYGWLMSIVAGKNAQESYQAIFKELGKWKFMGRFSIELFTEILVHFYQEDLINIQLKAPEFNWKHGSNITSGLLNMFYDDEEANMFDKGDLKIDANWITYLNSLLEQVQQAISETYPEMDTDLSLITPKICSWRNLFKNSRYGGYHHDRQLEQLIQYQNTRPYNNDLWLELFQHRSIVFVPDLLGEIGGWTGIRTERKKDWLRKGLTGIEEIRK